MAEDDRLARAPVLVVDLGAVLGCDRAHRFASFSHGQASSSWSHARVSTTNIRRTEDLPDPLLEPGGPTLSTTTSMMPWTRLRCELPRILLPRTPVNKGKRGQGRPSKAPLPRGDQTSPLNVRRIGGVAGSPQLLVSRLLTPHRARADAADRTSPAHTCSS